MDNITRTFDFSLLFFFFRMHAIQTFTKTWLLMNDNWCSLGDVSCCIRIDLKAQIFEFKN